MLRRAHNQFNSISGKRREDCMKVCSIEICLHGYYVLPSAPRLAGLRCTTPRNGSGWVGFYRVEPDPLPGWETVPGLTRLTRSTQSIFCVNLNVFFRRFKHI